MDPHAKAPIIIKKVVKGHGGHHGGAWKVAYADFVTAMMALFIVLWLMNTDEKTKTAIAGYFKDPSGKGTESGTGQAGSGDNLTVEQKDMGKLKDKIENMMKQLPEFSSNLSKQVQMTVTGEGLRIELLETEKGVFFETGNAQPTENAEKLLTALAGELSKLKNPIALEGHTDSRPFAGKGNYSNWELSTDRANAARRSIAAAGLDPARITQVRGFADQRLKIAAKSDDPSNRRVTVIVQYTDAPPAPEAPGKGGHAQPAKDAHGAPAKQAAAAAPAKPASGH